MALLRRQTRRLSLARDTRGLSTVEYIILFVLIAIVGITVWQLLGGALEENVEEARDEIAMVGSGGSRRSSGPAVEGTRSAEEESSSSSMSGGSSGSGNANADGEGMGMGMGGGARAAGVVSRPSEGGPSVYTVGAEEESNAGAMWIVVGFMVLLVLGGFVFISKMRRGNAG